MPGGLLLKRCSEKFHKIRKKTPCQSLFLMKFQLYSTYSKKRLQQRCFLWVLQNLSKHLNLQNISRQLLNLLLLYWLPCILRWYITKTKKYFVLISISNTYTKKLANKPLTPGVHLKLQVPFNEHQALRG